MTGPYQVRRPENDAEWAAYYDLRWRVLRAPWNQPVESRADDAEVRSEHAFVVDESGQPLATGRLYFNTPDEARIRSMAVAPHVRGQGLGRRVIEHLEQIARRHGATTIKLNARDDAVGFYARLGYEEVGEGPLLFGEIPHVKMRKRL